VCRIILHPFFTDVNDHSVSLGCLTVDVARHSSNMLNEQALVSLKLKKSIDAEGGRTFAVIIEGG